MSDPALRYRARVEEHLRTIAAFVPAVIYSNFVDDYRCVAQEVRNETARDFTRYDASKLARERAEGRAEGIREAVAQMLGPKLFAEAFADTE